MKEYIEREELAKFLKEEINECEVLLNDSDGEDDRYEQAVESRMLGLVDAWRKVTNTEAADVVEVRHGYWEDKPSGRYMHIASWCSVCGQKSGIGGIESNRHKPYCPNCGAKMDGKGEK